MTNCPLLLDFLLVGLTDFAGFRGFARRTIPRRFSKERIGLLAFTTISRNDKRFEKLRFDNLKRKFKTFRLCSFSGDKSNVSDQTKLRMKKKKTLKITNEEHDQTSLTERVLTIVAVILFLIIIILSGTGGYDKWIGMPFR